MTETEERRNIIQSRLKAIEEEFAVHVDGKTKALAAAAKLKTELNLIKVRRQANVDRIT